MSEKDEAHAQAQRLLNAAAELIQRATELADKFGIQGLEFAPAYGMGGSYLPVHREFSMWNKDDPEDLKSVGYYRGTYDAFETGWISSSSQC